MEKYVQIGNPALNKHLEKDWEVAGELVTKNRTWVRIKKDPDERLDQIRSKVEELNILLSQFDSTEYEMNCELSEVDLGTKTSRKLMLKVSQLV